MATITSDAVTHNALPKSIYTDVRFTSVTLTSAQIANGNIVQMIPVYKGETVVSVELVSTDLDTNGTPTIDLEVGDGGDPDRFLTASTIGRTGGRAVHDAGIPYTYTADDTIDVKIAAAAATANVAGGTLTLVVTIA